MSRSLLYARYSLYFKKLYVFCSHLKDYGADLLYLFNPDNLFFFCIILNMSKNNDPDKASFLYKKIRSITLRQ